MANIKIAARAPNATNSNGTLTLRCPEFSLSEW